MKHNKYQWTVLLLLASCLLPLQAAKVYRSIDENGNVVFSDKPQKGAETIEVGEPHTYKSLPYKKITPTEKKAAFAYKTFKITKPAADEVISGNTGNVSIVFSVEPGLQANKGHKIVYRLDGGEMIETTSLSHDLSNISRGSHTIQAQIKDKSDKIVKSSEPVTFHMKRHSILTGPGKKNNP